jgi:hypothetical protein
MQINAPFRFALVSTGLFTSRLDTTLERWAESEKLDFANCVKLDERRSAAFVFARGRSIRGFHVAQGGSRLRTHFDLAIEECASRADWQALFSLLALLLARGARGTEEDGLPLSAGGVRAEEAARRARFYFRRDVHAMRHARAQRVEPLALSTPLFTLALGETDLGSGPLDDPALEAIEARLVERARQQV